jgi:hypothetical protein
MTAALLLAQLASAKFGAILWSDLRQWWAARGMTGLL